VIKALIALARFQGRDKTDYESMPVRLKIRRTQTFFRRKRMSISASRSRFFKPRSNFARACLIAAVMFTVSACSSTDDEDADLMADQSAMQGTAGGPLGDVYGADGQMGGGAAPGTQADLVVNVGDRVFFGYDRYDISDEARMTLDKQANWLRQYANLNITVEGHADERGTREYNLALGDRRATAVKNYLVASGIDASRINTISYGKERPAVPGSDDTSHAQNRRGVTKVD
jgi:peptidoglycan-associated lipoprotein